MTSPGLDCECPCWFTRSALRRPTNGDQPGQLRWTFATDVGWIEEDARLTTIHLDKLQAWRVFPGIDKFGQKMAGLFTGDDDDDEAVAFRSGWSSMFSDIEDDDS